MNLNNYCIKMNMFCAPKSPIIAKKLTKTEADILCRKLNSEELDIYVSYTVEKLKIEDNLKNTIIISDIDPYGEENW